MTATDTRAIVDRYFATWLAEDADGYRALLADDMTFRGPLGSADSGDEAAEGMKKLAAVTTGIDVKKTVVDGPDALSWFDLTVAGAERPVAVANWTRVDNGRITSVRVAFDPRPMLG